MSVCLNEEAVALLSEQGVEAEYEQLIIFPQLIAILVLCWHDSRRCLRY